MMEGEALFLYTFLFESFTFFVTFYNLWMIFIKFKLIKSYKFMEFDSTQTKYKFNYLIFINKKNQQRIPQVRKT